MRLDLFNDKRVTVQIIINKGPAVLFALVIFIGSSLPGFKLPEFEIDFSDKIIHFLEFGILGILLFNAFRFPRPAVHPYFIAVSVGLLYAMLDEFHQFFVPGRHTSIYDFIADALGIMIFAGISAILNPAAISNMDTEHSHQKS